MGQKDIAEKMLAEHADVFADILNVLLFGGNRLVKPEELATAPALYGYKADDSTLHEVERDIAKYWQEGKVRIALFGMENQTKEEPYFPMRAIGYDGNGYRSQLIVKKDTNGTNLPLDTYPVVTMVLYFGTTRWTKQKTLLECFHVPEELKPYVSDYKINLFEIAFLSEEQVAMFQSDFRIVADFFVQKRKNKDYQPSTQVIRHVDEMLKLMSILTGDSRYEAYEKKKEGGDTMCEVLDKVENRGIEKGIEKGIGIGIKKGRLQAIFESVALGDYSVKRGAEKLNLPVDAFLEQMQAAGFEPPATL